MLPVVAAVLTAACSAAGRAPTSDATTALDAALPPPGDAAPAGVDPALVGEVDALVAAARAGGRHMGLVVGLFVDGARGTSGYGQITAGGPAPDEHTVFEIGSITKVVTATLLASYARTGEVAFDAPAGSLFPPGITAPTFRGQQSFTLQQLASHTSGLPRLPSDLLTRMVDLRNPYASYTRDDLYAFLGKHQLGRAPGASYEYSNLGAGLLGDLLATRAGTSYEAAVQERILGPLALADTAVTPSAELRARLAPGHDQGAVVPGWDLGVFAGAGALKSTVADMMTFLAANVAPPATPVGADLEATHAVRFDARAERLKLGLGWHVVALPGEAGDVHWHNGGTGGYRSFLGFHKARRVGAIVLGNSSTDVTDLGLRIIAKIVEQSGPR